MNINLPSAAIYDITLKYLSYAKAYERRIKKTPQHQVLSSFHMWKMMEICISLKMKRNQRDRPSWRHWFVTFVSTEFVLTIYVTRMFDTRIRFTFFVWCCLFRFSCSAHGYTCEGNSNGGRRKCVKGGASDAQDAPRTRRESGDQ